MWNRAKRGRSTGALRLFVVLQVLVLWFISWRLLIREFHPAIIWSIWSIGLILGVLGLLQPKLFRWQYVTWTTIAAPLGWIVSRVMLASVFYIVITPIAIWRHRAGYDPLLLKKNAPAMSYWKRRSTLRTTRDYFKPW